MKPHFLLILVLVLSLSAYGQRRSQSIEQISFGSETAVKSPIRIPGNVLDQLARYDNGRLKQCQKDELSRQSNISKHFAATKINLNNDRRQDLMVQAQTWCFMGAHNTTFWIFTETNRSLSPKYNLIFSIQTDFIDVLRISTKGYRDIKTASHTAVELYTTIWKFDGNKYVPRACTITDFKTNKITRIRCED